MGSYIEPTKCAFTIAVLNCGYTSPVIQKEHGQYSDIFAALLVPAAERVSRRLELPPLQININGFDTVNEEYPTDLDGIDAIIVSGSPNSAYEDLPWIKRLDSYISYVYEKHPRIKLYGSCFGHQIICQSLFRQHGVRVEKSPHGWELGVATVHLEEDFAQSFKAILPSRQMRLQSLHGDHVVFPPDRIENNVQLVGRSTACQNQGAYVPGRILTLQGHPEFDMWIEKVCLELVGKRVGWHDEFTAAAVAAADAPDDAGSAAELIMAFVLQE